MISKNFKYPLMILRKDLDTGNDGRSEKTQGEMTDEEKIISDKDESTVSHIRSGADPTGMVGPSHGMIETQDLSEEFMNGKVDLVDQMKKTKEAISDAFEGELRDGPEIESSLDI